LLFLHNLIVSYYNFLIKIKDHLKYGATEYKMKGFKKPIVFIHPLRCFIENRLFYQDSNINVKPKKNMVNKKKCLIKNIFIRKSFLKNFKELTKYNSKSKA